MPDIIALYEMKLNDQFCDHLLGYQFVQANSNTNSGGVGMFIKNNINFALVNTYDLNINACENIWIEVKLHNNQKSVFGVIYRHPTYQISDFQENLEILRT